MKSVSQTIGEFATGVRFEDFPADVVERAKVTILDAVGIAFASSGYDFAARTVAAASSLGDGQAPVLAHRQRLAVRDAALVNGVLIHGLDYDETHVPGVIHTTASVFPAALAVAGHRRLSGRDLLAGYLVGIEVGSRLGMVAGGGFHQIGFHPTGLVGAYACAAVAARLDGLPATGATAAQGIVGSMAGGLMEFLEDGAWTKRMHPGWAAVSGITASALAAQGFAAPDKVYEGRFGLYNTHLLPDTERDLALATDGLGTEWQMRQVAIKPYPACHFTHAFIDAALILRERENLRPGDIAAIRCPIADGEVKTICEPAENKLRPQSDYDAKFSLPFTVAAAFTRGQFTLAELYDDALTDPDILDLARRVTYEPDPRSGFPRHYTGEVIVETTDGRTLRHREQVNRGADDRPLSADDIERKFRDNMALVAGPDVAERVRDAVLALDTYDDAADLGDQLRA